MTDTQKTLGVQRIEADTNFDRLNLNLLKVGQLRHLSSESERLTLEHDRRVIVQIKDGVVVGVTVPRDLELVLLTTDATETREAWDKFEVGADRDWYAVHAFINRQEDGPEIISDEVRAKLQAFLVEQRGF